MKIGEAWQTYSTKLDVLRQQKNTLQKQQKELEKSPERQPEYDTVTIELAKVTERYDSVQQFMEKLMEKKTDMENIISAGQQGEAVSEAYQDMAKCLETARRIASGAKVPAEDVKKLMEFDAELYMMAITEAMMKRHKSDEEYESLWQDESDTENQNMDAGEIVDEMEMSIEVPETSS